MPNSHDDRIARAGWPDRRSCLKHGPLSVDQPRVKSKRITGLLAGIALLAGACGQTDNAAETPSFSPELSPALAQRQVNQRVFVQLLTPGDGARTMSPVKILINVNGFTITDERSTTDLAGRMYLLIDEPCVAAGRTIDTETAIEIDEEMLSVDLEPGFHTMCVQAADGFGTAVALTDQVSFSVLDDEPVPDTVFTFKPIEPSAPTTTEAPDQTTTTAAPPTTAPATTAPPTTAPATTQAPNQTTTTLFNFKPIEPSAPATTQPATTQAPDQTTTTLFNFKPIEAP